MMKAAGREALLLATLLSISAPPIAAQEPPIQTTAGGVVLTFQDADLAVIVSALAEVAGINLIYANLPTAQITLRTPQPIPQADVPDLIRTLAQTNGVVVDEQQGFLRLQGQLEQAPEPAERELLIYRLRHARAPVLASTLQALFSGGGGPRSSGPQAPRTLSQQLRDMEQASVTGAQPAIGQPQIVVGPGGAAELQSQVVIVPDETTNSLLVRATPSDWEIIQGAIQQLDLRPLQVVIEVVIAEVRRTNDLEVGVSFFAEGDGGRTTAELAGSDPEAGLRVRMLRGGVVDIDAAFSALSASGNVRILSRPVVLAQNNQEARILVGSERPFVQISRALPTEEGVRDQVVQYRDVGTALTILPTINPEGYVNLFVTQEVSSATSETQFGAPVISTREAQTQLLARDGQTIVLGGLVDRQEDRSRVGIPFLKDIPGLGMLFGSTRVSSGSSELFLFLTPHIVATDEDADRLRRAIEANLELLSRFPPILPLLPGPIIPDTSGTGSR